MSEDYYDTSAIHDSDEEIPDKLRTKIEEHLEALSRLRVQYKKDGNWRYVKRGITNCSSYGVDELCGDLIRIVRQHAEGSEKDREYRCKLEVRAEDGTTFTRWAPIKVTVDGEGMVEISDSTDAATEAREIVILRELLDHERRRSQAEYDQKVDFMERSFKRTESMADKLASVAEKQSELVGGYTAVGAALESMLTGVAGLMSHATEVTKQHSEENAAVQIAKLEHESFDQKFQAAVALLGPAGVAIGKQVAASFKKGKKGKVTQEEKKDPKEEVGIVPTGGPVQVDPEYAKGKAAALKSFHESLSEEERMKLAAHLGDASWAAIQSAVTQDSDTTAAITLIGLRQRFDQDMAANRVAAYGKMMAMVGILGDERATAFLEMMPDADEEEEDGDGDGDGDGD